MATHKTASTRDSRAESDWPANEARTTHPIGVAVEGGQAFFQLTSRVDAFERNTTARVGNFEFGIAATTKAVADIGGRVTIENERQWRAITEHTAKLEAHTAALERLQERARIADLQASWIRGIIAGLVILALGEMIKLGVEALRVPEHTTEPRK